MAALISSNARSSSAEAGRRLDASSRTERSNASLAAISRKQPAQAARSTGGVRRRMRSAAVTES